MKSKKRGRCRMIHDEPTCDFFDIEIGTSDEVIFNYSYSQAVSCLESCLPTMPTIYLPKHKAKAHLLRYAYLTWAYEEFELSLSDLQDIIGHQSKTSTEHYMRMVNNG